MGYSTEFVSILQNKVQKFPNQNLLLVLSCDIIIISNWFIRTNLSFTRVTQCRRFLPMIFQMFDYLSPIHHTSELSLFRALNLFYIFSIFPLFFYQNYFLNMHPKTEKYSSHRPRYFGSLALFNLYIIFKVLSSCTQDELSLIRTCKSNENFILQ